MELALEVTKLLPSSSSPVTKFETQAQNCFICRMSGCESKLNIRRIAFGTPNWEGVRCLGKIKGESDSSKRWEFLLIKDRYNKKYRVITGGSFRSTFLN
jgi:hypothetical protein